MTNKFGLKDTVHCNVESSRGVHDTIGIHSVWNFECYDKNGNLKWTDYERPNIVTHEGLDDMLTVYLDNGTQSATWYVGLVNTNTAAAATMTYAVPVFTEWDGYSELTRQEFVAAESTAKSITNSANKAVYTSTETKTLYGGALVGGGTAADTISDTAGGGTLFCYSKFSAGKPVENTDTFKIYSTISVANA